METFLSLRHWQKIILVLLLAGTVIAGIGRVQSQQTLTLADYVNFVHRAQAAMRNNGDCVATAVSVADVLQSITAIRLPDGTLMSVTHLGADDVLRQSPCRRNRAIAYLEGLLPGPAPAAAGAAGDSTDRPGVPEIAGSNTGNPAPGEENTPTGAAGSIPAESGSNETGSTSGEGTAGSTQNSGENGGNESGDSDGSGETGGDGGANDDGGSGDGSGEGDDIAADEEGADSGETADGNSGDATAVPADAAGSGEAGGSDNGAAPAGSDETGESSAAATAAEYATAAENETANEAAATPAAAPDAPPPTPTNNRSRLWLIAALAGLVILLLGTAVYLLLTPAQEEAPRRPRRPEEVESSVAALDLASVLAAEGKYREAVRHLFLAALLTLSENRAIILDHSLTNRELLREVREQPQLAQALQPVIATFDRVWYGYQPLTPADYETTVRQIARLEKFRHQRAE